MVGKKQFIEFNNGMEQDHHFLKARALFYTV